MQLLPGVDARQELMMNQHIRVNNQGALSKASSIVNIHQGVRAGSSLDDFHAQNQIISHKLVILEISCRSRMRMDLSIEDVRSRD